MYYFDNKFLMYYLNLEIDLKVYVNGEYLQITDAYDVSDPNVGYGYTIYGEPRKFDYREIEHIMVGNKTFNLDQLEKAYAPKDEKPKGEKEEEKPKGETEEEKPAKAEENIQMHSYVQNIDPTHPKFQTKGSVVMLDEGWVTYEYYSTESGKLSTTTVKQEQVKII
jgi:hypothetical protein